jgi:3-oxoacyl-[acyl-carrier-protein] synthase-1
MVNGKLMTAEGSERSRAGAPAPCHLVAVGASTGVGGTAPVSIAAFRAGLTRTERVSQGGGEDEWSHAVRAGTLESSDVEERARSLLVSALAQLGTVLKKCDPSRVRAWSVGPAFVKDVIARRLRLRDPQVASGAEHGSAGLLALGDISRALNERSIDVAVAAGVGVLSDSGSLARARGEGRVLGGTSSFGTVPGEAAAALVFVSDRMRQELELPSLGRLLAVASADETVLWGGPEPCLGEGLVRAAREALAGLPDQSVAHVLCNLNGERERTDEWGFALPRLSRFLVRPGAFVTPISAWGDVGAPSGLLLVALASALGASSEVSGRSCLIWTGGRERARAAALFEAPGPERHPAAATEPIPGWARALDDSVLAELVDEGGFRYDQRQFRYASARRAHPDALRPALTRVEDTLDTIVRGLVECGQRAWERLEDRLEKPAPGVLYMAVRVLFEAGQHERAAHWVREHAPSAPFRAALCSALMHARPRGAAIAPIVDHWMASGPTLAPLALQLAAQNAIRIPGAVLASASEALSEDAVDDAAAWLAALARLADPAARRCIARWQLSRHERLRRDWALAELCMGGAEGRQTVLARAEQDPAMILPASVCVDAPRARPLRELASALSGADACLALGILGDVGGLPHLVGCLNDAERADAAASALELLLGEAPRAQRLEPDPDDRAPPNVIRAISHDSEAWQERVERVTARHPQAARLRAGGVASLAATCTLIERLHVLPRARSYLAHELSLRWRALPSIEVDSLLRQQGELLRATAGSPLARQARGWDEPEASTAAAGSGRAPAHRP